MAVDFSGHPMFPGGFNSPTRFEADIFDCEVDGQIPADLQGTFYRLQCDFAYPPPRNEWVTGFNGDGHVSMFRFANGSVDYKGRYVKTERLLAERKARKRLFGVYRNHFTDDPSVKNVYHSAANTHIYWHGGKLMVLKEDSLPYLVDPHTLETQGTWDFNGKYRSLTFSAHPKIDPVSGKPTMVGLLPRDGDAEDVRWYKGPARNTLHFLNAVDQKGKVEMELPVSDTATSPSQIKRWSFDLKSRKKEEFGEEAVGTANGVLARMDDRFNSLGYKYCYVGNRDPSLPYAQARGANMGGRVTNTWQRLDISTGKTNTFDVGPVQSLQEACFVPRNAQAAEGDGYLVGVASNYAEMHSELVIVDAIKMEQGAIATVKLPFRLRSGTHGNWMPATDIPVKTLET